MRVFLTNFLKQQSKMWGLFHVLWEETVLWCKEGLVSEEDVGGSGLEGLRSVRPLGADQGELLFPVVMFLAVAHANKITLFAFCCSP